MKQAGKEHAGERNPGRKAGYSLKWQMMGVVLICWMIPFAFLIGILGVYLASNHSGMVAANFKKQLEFNSKICVERLNAVVDASRKASYDGKLLQICSLYGQGAIGYVKASRDYQTYLADTYQKNDSISSAVLWFVSDPDDLFSVYNERAGGTYQQIKNYEKYDKEAAAEFARTLNTRIGFLYRDGALYLVRNLMDSRYVEQGVLVFRLNQDYCFGSLKEYPSGDGVYIGIDDIRIPLAGEELLAAWTSLQEKWKTEEDAWEKDAGHRWSKGRLYLTDEQQGSDYTFRTVMRMQKEITQFPFYGYPYLLGGMILILIPMFVLMLWVFQKQVSGPVAALSEGAKHIQEGELGYQVRHAPVNLEFAYLTDSMNQMSSHLKRQFDKIYQEEIALREARIMALQSHINPHFMNNTLEIINWEARLGGNLQVSKMIGALSTMLDAAMDRRRRPLVRLAEEMGYVNAYLYITKERLGKRITVETEIPEELMDYQVPRLILQPVVENAVEHGVVPRGSGTVKICGYCRERYLYLVTVNDGGMTQEDKERIRRLLDPKYNAGKESAVNLGIANVNQRLRILYGEPCGLAITEDADGRVEAKLTMPLLKNENEVGGMDKNIQ